ncbi:MAG: chromosomal replication initiator protein DnaA [Planctomycetes bacterium]|jgi:chromosomal replication initiator protein|nr:chromosomal replication initiator protein DnaA [Planctomycetota bacterium]MBT6453479.1 chromosomal replication initiator protein DnaA [Planctomycetota bacterium]MBT6785712.1 chromosomal replication initiator protein DnaA [Planctomycetota bacterium]MBT6969106.1 chromosomal replication initiator protein DnaA [Planctomycetota bacterium]MBT7639697.1 chromosomal replication initiator protein DnaA [Planctomycetota bacterium]
MNADLHWDHLRAAITPIIGDAQMGRWFQRVTPVMADEGVLELHLESRFSLDKIGNRFKDVLQSEARKLGIDSIQLRLASVPPAEVTTEVRQLSLGVPAVPEESEESSLTIAGATATAPGSAVAKPLDGMLPPRPDGLRRDHTLDRFVVGRANRLAFSAALEVLRTPGVSFNPLFLHGGCGLGKTHLLQAITRQFFIQGERRMRYLPAEHFVHQFIGALQQKTLPQFRKIFRELRVLAIDDIQAFAGKPRSQQELLETVDAIAQRGGQVLLACDVPPRKLDRLHQQLKNRFSAGLVALVDPPDLETRISILRQEVVRGGVHVPEEVIHHIAGEVRNSSRELLGVLVRVVAECELSNSVVSLPRAKAILDPIAITLQRRITIDIIVERIGRRWGVPPEEIVSRSKTRNTAMARNVATYLARILTDHSLFEIGEKMGGRSHSTVSSAYRKIQKMISTDPELRDEIEKTMKDLRG